MLFGRRKYASINVRKKDLPNGLWVKCHNCGEIVYKQEIESRHGVCPKCNYHSPVGWEERLAITLDEGSFVEWDADLLSVDPLGFSSYPAKLEEHRKKTNLKEAIVCGLGKINFRETAIGIMDFRFMGASMEIGRASCRERV